MDELVRWLGEQLDEDERIARAAGGRSEQTWEADLSGKDPLGMPSWPAVVRYVTDGRLRGAVANLPVMNERSEDRMVHIAANDPARVLREIDAKRKLLALYVEHERMDRETFEAEGDHARSLVSLRAAYLDAVRHHAAVYADRPGYREEWRP